MNAYPRNAGKFGKKRKAKVIVRWIFLLLIIAAVLSVTIKHAPRTVTVSQPDQVQGCTSNAQCKAKLENFAAQTLVQEKIDDLNAQEQQLQNQLEQLRQQELSLQ